MASMTGTKGGGWVIQFFIDRRHRKTIRIDHLGERSAQRFKEHVERIALAYRNGMRLEPEETHWLAKLDDDTYEKLVKTGIVEPRQTRHVPTIREVITEFGEKRRDVKASTRANWAQGHESLAAFVGEKRPIDKITKAQAEDWRQEMIKDGLKEATIRKRIRACKTLMNWAKRRGYVDASPLTVLASASIAGNQKPYVSVEVAERVIEKLPDHRWRLLFALGRFAGLRLPSEAWALRWSHVDWDRNEIRVPVPKLAHLPGKGERNIPIFEKLRPYLQEAYDAAETGEDRVIALPPTTDTYLRKIVSQAIGRAGVKSWRAVFHSLRASCETDLMKHHPLHVVCRWIGHDIKIAEAHYLQVTETDHAKAVGDCSALHYALQSSHAPERTEAQKPDFQVVCASMQDDAGGEVGVTGLEPVTSSL